VKVLSVSDRIVAELISDDSPVAKGTVDLIIGCGDLPPEYLAKLRVMYDVPLFYVLGNHDIRHEIVPQGCDDITGKIVTRGGCSFIGFSGSRWYNGNQNQYHEREMKAQIWKLWFGLWRLKRLDAVVTHAPPRHVKDGEDRCHKGFNCYRTLIEKYNPRFFIHGHIHRFFDKPEDRVTMVAQTQVINTYGHHIFEL